MSSLLTDTITLFKEPLIAIESYRGADAEAIQQRALLQIDGAVVGYPTTLKVQKIIRDFIKNECGIFSDNITICHDGNSSLCEHADAFGHLDQTRVTAIRIGAGDFQNIDKTGSLTPAQKFIIAHEVRHLVKGHALAENIGLKASSKASLAVWGVCVVVLPTFGIANIPLSYVAGCVAGKITRYMSHELYVQKEEDEADDFAKALSPEILQGGIDAMKRLQGSLQRRKATFISPIQYLTNKLRQPNYPSIWTYCKDLFRNYCIRSNGDNYLNLSHLTSRRIARLQASVDQL